jgi:hypothetical protein
MTIHCVVIYNQVIRGETGRQIRRENNIINGTKKEKSRSTDDSFKWELRSFELVCEMRSAEMRCTQRIVLLLACSDSFF